MASGRRSTHASRHVTKRVRQQDALAREAARDARVMGDDEIPDDLDAPMTYENALRYMRRQKLSCRGPLSAKGLKLRARALKANDLDEASRINREYRGVRNPSTGALDLCGYDLTDLIEARKHPLDGSELAYRCPKCGNEGTLRPARFTLIDGPPSSTRHRSARS